MAYQTGPGLGHAGDASGEAEALEGWLAYGAALNEGRALFASDEQFGQWVDTVNDKLSVTPNLHERAAAMWAAANPDQLVRREASATPERFVNPNLGLR